MELQKEGATEDGHSMTAQSLFPRPVGPYLNKIYKESRGISLVFQIYQANVPGPQPKVGASYLKTQKLLLSLLEDREKY